MASGSISSHAYSRAITYKTWEIQITAEPDLKLKSASTRTHNVQIDKASISLV